MQLTTREKKNNHMRSSNLVKNNVGFMYGKVPPQAKDLEEAILGAILLDKLAFDTVVEILHPEVFYVDAHKIIFNAITAMSKRNAPIDLLTVVEELKSTNELDLVGGPFYLTKLTTSVVSSANVETHSRIIIQKFIQRELIRISGEINIDAYEESTDVFELLESAEQKILGVGTSYIQGGMIHISNVLLKAFTKIEEWRKNDGTLTGIASGFPKLDRATRGFQPGDLIILAARPSVGKTAFALNIIRNAALNNTKPTTVAVWSLEMKAISMVLRMLAAESNIFT